MKKLLLTLLLSLVPCSLFLTGCGGSSQQGIDKLSNNFSGAEVKLGMITPLNSTEEKFGGLLDKIETAADSDSRHRPKFYDNLRAMVMAVKAGDVQDAGNQPVQERCRLYRRDQQQI